MFTAINDSQLKIIIVNIVFNIIETLVNVRGIRKADEINSKSSSSLTTRLEQFPRRPRPKYGIGWIYVAVTLPASGNVDPASKKTRRNCK